MRRITRRAKVWARRLFWLWGLLWFAFGVALGVIGAPWWFGLLAFCVVGSAMLHAALHTASRVMEDIDNAAERLGIASDDEARGR